MNDADSITLPSGKSIYANWGYVGINKELKMSTGFDDTIDISGPEADGHHSWNDLSSSDVIALCGMAIGWWTALRERTLAGKEF